MFFRVAHICLIVSLLLVGIPAGAQSGWQEHLRASRIQARASRRNLPSLGLPIRADGSIDNVILYRNGCWRGMDAVDAPARWVAWRSGSEGLTGAAEKPAARNQAGEPSAAEPAANQARETIPPAIETIIRSWAEEKPAAPVEVVAGPFRRSHYIAICKKTRGGMGWKAIAFIIPPEGLLAGRSPYAYSTSVNRIEAQTGYNLYHKLPAHLQETIEEMTATELLSPFQEFDEREMDLPEKEREYDWEMDMYDM